VSQSQVLGAVQSCGSVLNSQVASALGEVE
jgi:uncharacterized membrane protein